MISESHHLYSGLPSICSKEQKIFLNRWQPASLVISSPKVIIKKNLRYMYCILLPLNLFIINPAATYSQGRDDYSFQAWWWSLYSIFVYIWCICYNIFPQICKEIWELKKPSIQKYPSLIKYCLKCENEFAYSKSYSINF